MFFNKFRSTKLKHSRKFCTASFFMKEIIEIIFYLAAAAASSEPEKFLILVNENSTFMMWKCWCEDDENVMLTDFYLMLHINISVYSFFHFVIFFLPVSELRGEVKRTKIRACINAWKCEMWKCTVREVKCSKNKQRLWKCEEIKISKKGKLLLFMESDSENCYIKWKYLSG